jgi:mono/diheme cytochrome c family protein
MTQPRREFVLWMAIAITALMAFAVILRLQYSNTQNRWATTVTPKPAQGSAVFRDKGCANCHDGRAGEGQLGPPLRQRAATLPQLVTAMWNHAPRMYEAMQQAKLPYPTLSYDETGQLVAYLYLTGFSDEPGDPARGQQLFVTKNCARCHGSDGKAGTAPKLQELARADSLLTWTQVLWNHAAAMESSMRALGIAWPHFQANELRDLFAYLRQQGGNPATEPTVPAADPDRGWQVFQAKYCINCHALRNPPTPAVVHVSGPPQRPAGPVLGADGKLPPTFSQFGEAMLNHFPDMHRAMHAVGQAPPTFESQEMADLAVFLYSLHYQEPSGSPHVGASIFAWRGCADCHGTRAEGTARGPALRGRGQTYTAVRLANNLWRHGAKMYEQSRKAGQSWPVLQESDVGDLLSFLNTPIETAK